ncbi:MAG: D-alanyl-D-alanine carboxypeptidase/D-alanyl-D-alanine-endopeptidase [Pleurocapsa sp. SU_5_0]|nr:D-alanyl-D-alanine carboxypeptidase/D-alanyl-D-alanine-endopeptidase [Pleurocapsa sp. SU_5_0]
MKLVFNYFKLLGILCFLSGNPLVVTATSAQGQPKTTLDNLDHKPKCFCSQDLSQAIEQVISRPELARSRWGIEIQTLTGESLYSLDGDKFFNPASTAKLLVSAAGLQELGADYRLKTPIYSQGNAPVLKVLRVKGQGDPTISTRSLKNIVHQLQAKGVKQIENLIIDDTYFAPPTINPTWEWADVHSYFATAVNSAILNQNTVTLTLLPQQIGQPVKFFWDDAIAANQWRVINQATTGKADLEYAVEIDGDLGQALLKLRGELAVNEPPDVWDLAVVDPAQYFLESLRFHLAQGGITVTRGTVIEQEVEGKNQDFLDTELTAIYAPPLRKILAEINQESNNLYAEVLGKILAQELQVATPIDAINKSLKQIGIKPDEYVLVDASGLSRQNLVTPQTLVEILRLMSQSTTSKTAQAYRQSLAIAGIKGTLKNRFIDTPIESRLWAKTGTLTGVGALSGYLQTKSNSTLILSILVNNSELENKEIRQAIDEIVVIVNQLESCE